MRHPKSCWLGAFAVAGLLTVTSSAVSASGFAIIEQSVKGLGAAFSDSAAAEDASTVFFNAAGLGQLRGTQVQVAGHVIAPSASFTDGGSALNPAFTGGVAVAGSLTGNNGGGASVTGLIPNLYLHHQIQNVLNGRAHFGFGLNVPFGLKTNYDEGWVGRYHALTSDIKTFNFNPSLAFEVSDQLSVGAGFNSQFMEARLTNAFDQSAACLGSEAKGDLAPGTCGALSLVTPGTVATDGHVDLRNARDWGLGWNAGVLWRPLPTTRVGVHYRSKITQQLHGTAVFTGFNPDFAGGAKLVRQGATADLTLPESASVNFYHAVNDQWAVHGDVSWTRWSRLQKLIVDFALGNRTTLPLDWDNTFRYSGGVTFKHSSKLTLRAGAAFDESPIPDAARRTPRIPGEDRTWITVGASYRFDDHLSVDAGYAHLFIPDPKIAALPDTTTRNLLTGKYDADVNIGNIQVVYEF